MVGYKKWFVRHGKKHRAVMRTLQAYSDDEIIEYFRYENLKQAHPDFCPLFHEDKRCHDTEKLNCYFCACPFFRFNEKGFGMHNGKLIMSYCAAEARQGSTIQTEDAIHQDCSACLLPHRESVIRKRFERDWFAVMKEVPKCDD